MADSSTKTLVNTLVNTMRDVQPDDDSTVNHDTSPTSSNLKIPVVKDICKQQPKNNQPTSKTNKKLGPDQHEDSSSSSSESSEDELSESSSPSESSDDSTSPPKETSSSSDTSDSERNDRKQRRRARAKAKAKKSKRTAEKKMKKAYSPEDSSTESECSDNEAEDFSSKNNAQQPPSCSVGDQPATNDITTDSSDVVLALAKRLTTMEAELTEARRNQSRVQCCSHAQSTAGRKEETSKDEPKNSKSEKTKIGTKVEFKRIDQLWDRTIHNYRLKETVEDADSTEWDQYIFTVRRNFNSSNKHTSTVVDIRSEPLREALSKVMDGVRGISFVGETATLDPNMLFLYLEETRQYMKALKQQSKTDKKSKARKSAATKASHLKILVKYLDTDYAVTKKTVLALLKANTITFDLLWALFKPNAIVYTPTYGNEDEPRTFKVECVTKITDALAGDSYAIEGRYLNYDGRQFGMVDIQETIDAFTGTRKITSLGCYPLQHHREADDVRAMLIERGKKFVSLKGQNYKFHHGMAFCKRDRVVAKVNVNGRVMVDPVTHKRINPNYPVGHIRRDQDGGNEKEDGSDNKPRYVFRMVEGPSGEERLVKVEVGKYGNEIKSEKMGDIEGLSEREFTEEELIIASPVVLGFAFSEKLWLEFTVSGIRDIEWNEKAFESLVLPENQKSIVKALVESHTFNEAQNIDDVIQGKGRGLVAVLHGPPGTGKTLTAEGIAELLKRPLYMVSIGELGIDSRTLESELNNILDVAHSWGAVLLLDEADIFLEKRGIHEIHRNALVSIFLRLLEYFQGILFLTTNRVETFDDAFQSRIHVALRYGDLTTKAKRSVWKIFLEKVQAVEGVQTATFTEKDFDALARHNLNGRQIKNSVRTAQALAVNEKLPLSMDHIKRVLEVAESFDRDLRGGSGYLDAMRSYT